MEQWREGTPGGLGPSDRLAHTFHAPPAGTAGTHAVPQMLVL